VEGLVVRSKVEMKVLLIDVDQTGFPNLALMKLSAWHKQRGDHVSLNNMNGSVSVVYISCVFTKNRPKALGIARFFEELGVEVHIGGYGINDAKLPDEIEHIMPDYSLYGSDYSMGFTSRGCIRRCPWCIVWRKEGSIREHSPIEEFWNRRHEKVLLLDNNFLASERWAEKLKFLTDRRLKVCFNQGLDIRLVDQEVARQLARTRYFDDQFRRRRLYFAFDSPDYEDAVIEGIRLLKRYGIPPRHLMFYVLVGFGIRPDDYTWDYFLSHDYYRLKLLCDLGVLPYIMLYNDRQDIPLLRRFKRWACQPRLYKSVPWEKYQPDYSFKKWRKGM